MNRIIGWQLFFLFMCMCVSLAVNLIQLMFHRNVLMNRIQFTWKSNLVYQCPRWLRANYRNSSCRGKIIIIIILNESISRVLFVNIHCRIVVRSRTRKSVNHNRCIIVDNYYYQLLNWKIQKIIIQIYCKFVKQVAKKFSRCWNSTMMNSFLSEISLWKILPLL